MKYIFVFVMWLVSATGYCYNETEIPKNKGSLPHGRLFTIAGSNTVGASLAPSWASAYLTHKGAANIEQTPLDKANETRVQGTINGRRVYIDILAHGSSTGFVALQHKQADLAMSSRPIKPAERAELNHLGNLLSPAAEHVVAIDGLAIIVNPRNNINTLGVDDIGKIFAGQITNWRQLGGRDQPITLYARDHNSGTWDTFKSLVLAKKFDLHPSAQRFESNDDLSDSVAADPGAIGFVGLASVRDAKALAVNDGSATALMPKPLFVATEDYPLARRLFLYTPERVQSPYVSEFVAFAQNNIGQQTVEQVGFVSQNPVPVDVGPVAGPEFYQSLARRGQRLSVNFRFRPGSAELDNKARQDALRLANYFRQPEQHNTRLQLVGFSNRDRTAEAADALSRLRAVAVKLELYRLGISAEPVVAFGDDIQVASEGLGAKNKNDRVEVWVFKGKDIAAPGKDEVARY